MASGKRARKALERAESQQRSQLQQQIIASQVSFWSGPLPAPEVLREYDSVVPGSADRIIAMAERQSDHRRNLESIAISGGNLRATMGSIFGFVIGMAAIIVGYLLVTNGQEIGGYSTMLLTVTALVGVFVYGRRTSRQELARKTVPPTGQQIIQ
jgi:uncharacterized membrane protein